MKNKYLKIILFNNAKRFLTEDWEQLQTKQLKEGKLYPIIHNPIQVNKQWKKYVASFEQDVTLYGTVTWTYRTMFQLN